MADKHVTTIAVTGNEAVAEAMRQINPDVVCAYPITPQTEVVQLFAQMVADGLVDTEFVTVESEHSAMSAAIGSAAGGARTMTATSSQGFALMWELLYVAASYRLPIVMTTVNRALSGPINIHCDHSDSMGGRDSGWLQIYGEDHQQAYDNCLQCVRIAEHMDVRTPAMHMYDGYVISGAIGPLVTLEDEKVREFIGPYVAVNPMLDMAHPVTVGPFDGLHGWYFEHKVSQNRAMDRAFKVIADVADEYAELTGRHYGLLDPYRLDDAEIAIVVVGSTAGTTRMVVDKLRARGVKAGMVRVRVFRPFPARGLRQGAGARQGGGGHGPGRLVRRPGWPPLPGDPCRPLRQRPAAAGAALHLRLGRARHLPRQHRAGVRRARRDGAKRQAGLHGPPLPQPARRLKVSEMANRRTETAGTTAAKGLRALRGAQGHRLRAPAVGGQSPAARAC